MWPVTLIDRLAASHFVDFDFATALLTNSASVHRFEVSITCVSLANNNFALRLYITSESAFLASFLPICIARILETGIFKNLSWSILIALTLNYFVKMNITSENLLCSVLFIFSSNQITSAFQSANIDSLLRNHKRSSLKSHYFLVSSDWY